MDSYKKLLLANQAWVQDKLNVSPDYFSRTVAEQNPDFLWIGCSDSRVPAEDITGAEPGELFVHRNVANLVIHTDLNMLSVLQFAVEVLKVKHVIVCGHYGCGGVKNAMSHQDLGLINRWLHHIKDVYRDHTQELECIANPQDRFDRLVELNVAEQVQNLAQTPMIQRSWRRARAPMLHGWVYNIRNGYLKEIAMLGPDSRLDDIYLYEWPGGAVPDTPPSSEVG
jgi:carbonic anhydrase